MERHTVSLDTLRSFVSSFTRHYSMPCVSGGLCLVSGVFSRAVLSVVPCLVMATHFFRRVIDIDTSCPRREPRLQDDDEDDAWPVVSVPTEHTACLRATKNWRHFIKRISRIRRLRQYWAFLGRYTRPSSEDYEANFECTMRRSFTTRP